MTTQYIEEKVSELTLDWLGERDTKNCEVHDEFKRFLTQALKEVQKQERDRMCKELSGCVDAEIGCIEGGNTLTSHEQYIATEVCKNIKARFEIEALTNHADHEWSCVDCETDIGEGEAQCSSCRRQA